MDGREYLDWAALFSPLFRLARQPFEPETVDYDETSRGGKMGGGVLGPFFCGELNPTQVHQTREKRHQAREEEENTPTTLLLDTPSSHLTSHLCIPIRITKADPWEYFFHP
jgi:hypothetical protein